MDRSSTKSPPKKGYRANRCASRLVDQQGNEITRSEPRLAAIVEIPRWSFLKRGSTGNLDFVSPLPCPFNCGSACDFIGLEGDLLDVVILGPRLPRRSKVSITAYGAVGLEDRGLYDDKVICSTAPISARQQSMLLTFFRFYALCKRVLNFLRGQRGRTACVGWSSADAALARATPKTGVENRNTIIRF